VGSVTISQTNYRLYAYIAYVDPAAFDVLVKEGELELGFLTSFIVEKS
jgi:hypothetical protein